LDRHGAALLGRQTQKYDGYVWDGFSGTYWVGARYLVPAVAEPGRWLSQDPLGLQPGPNPYEYADNRPTNETDPSGLEPRLRLASKEELQRRRAGARAGGLPPQLLDLETKLQQEQKTATGARLATVKTLLVSLAVLRDQV
jgi:RHS repeat-associated protein